MEGQSGTSPGIVRQFSWVQKNPMFLQILVAVIVVLAGVGSGYLLASGNAPGALGGKIETAPGAEVTEEGTGIKDEKTFRDKAEGTLEKGGIEGEGTHHLTRPGGASQNVYLTSSVIDLDDFLGKKVEVWGETFTGQKAGWLMDVGRIKVQ